MEGTSSQSDRSGVESGGGGGVAGVVGSSQSDRSGVESLPALRELAGLYPLNRTVVVLKGPVHTEIPSCVWLSIGP